jgi:hypothetical protein
MNRHTRQLVPLLLFRHRPLTALQRFHLFESELDFIYFNLSISLPFYPQ